MMSKLLRASALVLSLSALAACSSGGGGSEDLKVEPANCEINGKSFGIVGGEVLGTGNELSASTVMVVHVNYKDDVSICTGTLIDKDKVLTAAHCISAFGGKSVIAFTNNIDCAAKAKNRTLRPVVKDTYHKDYSYWTKSLENASYDLAILKFTGGIPAGYKVRELPAKDFQPVASDTIVMSGYGNTEEKNQDSGVLRFTTATVSRLVKDFYLALIGSTVSIQNTWMLQQYDNGVCTGDSGGPLYVSSEKGLTLIGVTSMGVDNRATDEKNVRTCHGMALFTDLRPHLDWIRGKMNSL
ncbi:S1 family peptidase [Bdellovibrio sp. BCCA]|uniref:S1 family peptidase n=1 Tax=Bdellovibrio sp. BCCA TaxID=3136281 RepID=UPI0030F05FAB